MKPSSSAVPLPTSEFGFKAPNKLPGASAKAGGTILRPVQKLRGALTSLLLPASGIATASLLKLAAALTTLSTAATLTAAESVASVPPPARAGLHWIDWLVIVAYLGGVLWLGTYFAKRQSSASDYFIAARNHIHPFLIGISVFASLLSGRRLCARITLSTVPCGVITRW